VKETQEVKMATSFIDIVFFVYTFFSIYLLSLFLALYLPNKDKFFGYPKGKPEPITIVMPCYNESETIGEAIESLLKLDYPKNMLEIIVVDDKSTDNSVEVIKRYTEKYKNVRLIIHKKNTGCAAGPTNTGIRNAKYDYIAVVDADSMPDRDSLRKMIGFLQEDKSVGVVTCAILVKKPWNLWRRIQAYEYFIIAFTRKLLEFVDSIYVTPGPLALYRKEALVHAGLFDTKNLTQDIEMTWNLLSKKYKVRMCLDTRVYSVAPSGFRGWWKQRVRWNIGGIQTLIKYKGFALKKGTLGCIVMPIFAISMFLGVFGLLVLAYLLFRRVMLMFLATKYSIYASAAIISTSSLSFTPSILNFFGIASFLLGLWFTLYGLGIMKANELLGKENIFNIAIYLVVYLAIYPFTFLAAVYQMLRGKYSW
jgi:cellulose synthase/poly-beta-1,6-N-acetylglucosamine synthase-like glycosyltransferase